jgi:hypothetical protein
MITKLVNMGSKCLRVALLPVAWALSCVTSLLKYVEDWLDKIIERDLGK